MKRRQLSDTLIELIDSVQSEPSHGIVVTDLDLAMPMEAGSVVQNGRLLFYADAPHTRWQTGVLPPIHRCQLRVTLVSDLDGDDETQSDA